jgi:TonB family protein
VSFGVRQHPGVEIMQLSRPRTVSLRSLALAVLVVSCSRPPASMGISADSPPREIALLADPNRACRLTGAWTASGTPTELPQVTRCVVPRYPKAMIAADESGEIIVRFGVDSAGLPLTPISVVRSSDPLLRDATLAAIPFLRFAPSRAALRPVTVELPITFTLMSH